MADNGAPSAKRQKTAEIDANEAITFHFLDASKEPAAISEASTFSPDMCHQFFGDEEVSRGSADAKTPQDVSWPQRLANTWRGKSLKAIILMW
jgi:hypothetical protein